MATKIADDGKSIRAHMARLGLERNVPKAEPQLTLERQLYCQGCGIAIHTPGTVCKICSL